MKSVYYLSYSDIPQKAGLVFPNELQKDIYSPGIWVVAKYRNERILNELEFDAVNDNQLNTLKLVRVNRLVFQVNHEKHGKFFFRISRIFFRYEKYVGSSKEISNDCILYQLTSMNIEKLEQACSNGFFFVGRIDTSLGNRLVG